MYVLLFTAKCSLIDQRLKLCQLDDGLEGRLLNSVCLCSTWVDLRMVAPDPETVLILAVVVQSGSGFVDQEVAVSAATITYEHGT